MARSSNTAHTGCGVHHDVIVFSAEWSQQCTDRIHAAVLSIDHNLCGGCSAVSGDDSEMLPAGGADPLMDIEGRVD